MDRVLIVEDDRRLAASLIKGLRENGFDVAEAPSLAAARTQLDAQPVDLLILDLGLPDGEGLELLAEIQAARRHLPTIITTARSALERRLDAFETGADDYLVKPYAFAELLARIRIQLRHARQGQTTMFRVGDLEVDTVTRGVTRGGEPVALSPREFDLLAFLAASAGDVVTREMLARQVWHMRSWTPSLDNAIDVHISRLRDKVDRDPACRLLHTVRGAGFRLAVKP